MPQQALELAKVGGDLRMAAEEAGTAGELSRWFGDRLPIVIREDGPPPESSTDLPPVVGPAPSGDAPVAATPVERQSTSWWVTLWNRIWRFVLGRGGGSADADATSAPEQTSEVTPQQSGSILVEKLEDASRWAAAGFSTVTAVLLFFGVKEGVLDQAVRQNPFATLCVFILLGVGVLSALFAGAIAPHVRVRLWGILAAIAAMLLLTALFLPNLDVVRDVEALLDKGASGDAWQELAKKIGWTLAGLFVAGAAVALPLFFVRYLETDSRWDLAGWLASALVLAIAIGAAFFNARLQTRLSVAAGAVMLLAIAWSFAQKISLPAAAGVIILGVAATSLGLYGAAKLSVGSKEVR
jgi:hypothetical protein